MSEREEGEEESGGEKRKRKGGPASYCLYACVCVCMRVYACVCVCVCMCVWTRGRALQSKQKALHFPFSLSLSLLVLAPCAGQRRRHEATKRSNSRICRCITEAFAITLQQRGCRPSLRPLFVFFFSLSLSLSLSSVHTLSQPDVRLALASHMAASAAGQSAPLGLSERVSLAQCCRSFHIVQVGSFVLHSLFSLFFSSLPLSPLYLYARPPRPTLFNAPSALLGLVRLEPPSLPIFYCLHASTTSLPLSLSLPVHLLYAGPSRPT